MKTLNAVASKIEAIKVLNNWLNENLTDENASTNTFIEDCETRCACGQTIGMKAWYDAGEIAVVPICEACSKEA